MLSPDAGLKHMNKHCADPSAETNPGCGSETLSYTLTEKLKPVQGVVPKEKTTTVYINAIDGNAITMRMCCMQHVASPPTT